MRFGNFADTIKESYSEKLTKGVITNNEQKGMSDKNIPLNFHFNGV